MTEKPGPARRPRILLGILWALALVLWTAALLTTAPATLKESFFPKEVGFLLAKALHVTAYAFLAGYAIWLVVHPYRWLMILALSAHALTTELAQNLVPKRTGNLQDVLIDHLGIVLGLIAAWRYRRPG